MRGLCYFFLSILTQVNSKTLGVTGFVGHNVTLPCSYDSQTHGVLSFCWGQGKVPRSKCSNTILSSQDGEVSLRQSSRYQLLGSVADGDVSLTILHAEQSDAGVYGCRVEIPGWFNDYKVNIHLDMEEGGLFWPEPVEQPVTVDYILQTEAQDMLTTSSLIGTEAGDMMETHTTQFKAFLGAGNISRMAAILFFTVIIILVFIFRRTLLFRKKHQQPKTSPPENIYETIPVHH
ncbi:T-cell immunoglobulin and mucin domain-containing protein 4-like isoform X2 [Sphaeramia orbicularis]|uniref:T-cell immunoglobulin and mucin domain-containing protein 4-like isoform X2 n=1 Tax=Sphaeramia orbicularis TaxID=375764 RepID=UPI00117F82B5|nr:T-cell immunoglobulin and mucin domain-containing protein 4-like isoform X2 [Sphaeramia orbicularis]